MKTLHYVAVPEENLVAPDQPDKVKSLHAWNHARTAYLTAFWLICVGYLIYLQDRFDHPYMSVLFYGMDSIGDFIPIKQLRERYNRPRHEVPIDPEDQKDGDSAWMGDEELMLATVAIHSCLDDSD